MPKHLIISETRRFRVSTSAISAWRMLFEVGLFSRAIHLNNTIDVNHASREYRL